MKFSTKGHGEEFLMFFTFCAFLLVVVGYINKNLPSSISHRGRSSGEAKQSLTCRAEMQKKFSDLKNEEAIIEMLRTGDCGSEKLTAEDLSEILMTSDLPNLLKKNQLIDLLTKQQLSLLTVQARVEVLVALRKASKGDQLDLALSNVLLGTYGEDLMHLKAVMENAGSFWSLHELLYSSVQSDKVREEIRKHIHQESISCSQSNKCKPSIRPLKGRQLWQRKTKIVSDIDDTFISSGGKKPAGIDERYPQGTIYPGVGAFYRELELSGGGDLLSETVQRGWRNGEYLGNMIFLSARPHVFKDFVESREYQRYAQWLEEGQIHSMPTLLAGSLAAGIKMVFTNDYGPIGNKKIKNLQQHASLFPEYEYILIGDNGQADVTVATTLINDGSVRIKFAYIHQVQPVKDASVLKNKKIFFFPNYVEAALHAFLHGLISAPGLCRVTIAAVDEFAKLKMRTGDEQTKQDLSNSVVRALEALKLYAVNRNLPHLENLIKRIHKP